MRYLRGSGSMCTLQPAAELRRGRALARRSRQWRVPMPVQCILVVDDDPDQREGLAEILEISGYCVATAANGCEALEVAVKISPDLILLDMGMPIMNGWEVMDLFRSDVGLRDIPIIVISGE